MWRHIGIAYALLVAVVCTKPRTEAPMERQALARERPARQESAAEETSTAQAQTADYAYSIVEHATPTEMFADSTVTVLVKVKNTGDRPWLGQGEIKLGFYWTNEKDEQLTGTGGRAVVRKDTPPGAAVFFRCRVKAPEKAGTYRLVWDMIEEKVAWFESKGAKPLRVSVTVR